MSENRPMVLYHADCADGFCAAWVAHKVMPDAEFVPVQYGQDPPDVSGREVFILDFSYKRPVMNAMVGKARTLVLCDHHKTAQAELNEFYSTNSATFGTITRGRADVYCIFDMGKSGGRLAWEFFFPHQCPPWMVDYTEDRDLWLWKLPSSREVSAAIASYPREFSRWDDWYDMTRQDELPLLFRLKDEGEAILRYQQQNIESQAANASEIELDGHKVLAVNATMLISEIAGKLAEGRPFGASFFTRADGKEVWSLRSRDGGIDVSEVAKKRGGGGHRNAAGFVLERA